MKQKGFTLIELLVVVAFWGSWSVPTVAQVGRTACNYDGNKAICNSRWGIGVSDYDTTIINKP